jgi:uncharacterized protein
MELEKVIQILKQNKRDLNRLGVKSLAIFGSTVRNEATGESDIDLLVEFEGPATFDGYMETKFLIEDMLGRRVDLVTRQALRPGMRQRVESEAVHVA